MTKVKWSTIQDLHKWEPSKDSGSFIIDERALDVILEPLPGSITYGRYTEITANATTATEVHAKQAVNEKEILDMLDLMSKQPLHAGMFNIDKICEEFIRAGKLQYIPPAIRTCVDCGGQYSEPMYGTVRDLFNTHCKRCENIQREAGELPPI